MNSQVAELYIYIYLYIYLCIYLCIYLSIYLCMSTSRAEHTKKTEATTYKPWDAQPNRAGRDRRVFNKE